MSAIMRPLVLVAFASLMPPAWSGNRAMMEQNARELVEINREVLDSLQARQGDGEYRLTARVVEEHGRRIIKVDRFDRLGPPAEHPNGPGNTAAIPEQTPVSGGETGAGQGVLGPYGQYAPMIRFGRVAETGSGQVFLDKAKEISPASQPQAAPAAEIPQPLEALLKTHPDLKLIDLSPEEVKKLIPGVSEQPGGGAMLLLW